MTRWLRPSRPTYLLDEDIPHDVLINRGKIKNRMMAVTAFLIGALMAVGGTTRWLGQSLEVAMSFHSAAAVHGVILMLFATIMACGITAHTPRLLVWGAWGCAAWGWLMGVFSLYKLATSPATVDDIAFILWAYLGLDYLVNAQSHIVWKQ